MPKEEWGVKRACPNCSTRFYDLNNDPMTCPNCEKTFDLASLHQSDSRLKARDTSKASKAKETVEDAEVLLDDDDTAEAGDDLLEDDDDDSVSLDEIADVPADDDDN